MSELTANRGRVGSIDLLRGIVMVIMALDHVRDYFHAEAFTDDPLNLQTTTPALYFTRWITHFCAPIFVFLAGTSAYLLGQKKTKRDLSKFLMTRGLWLMLIEITIVSLGWTFNPLFNLLILQVIWAIGISMLLLGILVWLPYQLLFAIGIIIVFGHNLLDYPEAARKGDVGLLWDLVHHGRFSFYTLSQNRFFMVVYAFLPWTGLMIMGYALGKLYTPDVDPAYRKKFLLITGTLLLLLFVVVRWMNGYGDPGKWSTQKNSFYTFLSFINVNKYPPSLMFMSVTIGIALLVLPFLEKVKGAIARAFTIYGRVPFFYYVLHLYVIHTLCVIAFFIAGYGTDDIVSRHTPFLFRPPTFGYGLWAVYLIWIGVVALLYPLCKWYNNYKATHRKWWLSYL